MGVPLSGWNGGVMPTVTLGNITVSKTSEVTIGLTATNATGGAWGHCDNFTFLPPKKKIKSGWLLATLISKKTMQFSLKGVRKCRPSGRHPFIFSVRIDRL